MGVIHVREPGHLHHRAGLGKGKGSAPWEFPHPAPRMPLPLRMGNHLVGNAEGKRGWK